MQKQKRKRKGNEGFDKVFVILWYILFLLSCISMFVIINHWIQFGVM